MPLVCDSWVFELIDDRLNSFGINFGQNKIKCYELCCVMQRNKIHNSLKSLINLEKFIKYNKISI